jgi:hypothetical protein
MPSPTVLTMPTVGRVGLARALNRMMRALAPHDQRSFQCPALEGGSARAGAGRPALGEILATLHPSEMRHLLKGRQRRATGLKHSRSTGSAPP